MEINDRFTLSSGDAKLSSTFTENILLFLSLVGCNRPTGSNKIFLKIWHYALAILYFLYCLFFLIFGVLDLVYLFGDYLWILYFTMLFKCGSLRIAIVNIRKRVRHHESYLVISESEEALFSSLKYLKWVIGIDVAAILFYLVVVFSAVGFKWENFVFGIFMICGTLSYVCYMAGVVFFSVADARMAQKLVRNLIVGATDGTLQPSMYDKTQRHIQSIVEHSFWVNGLIFVGGIVNTVSAVTVLLLYGTIFRRESKLLALSFLVYVLVVLWTPDVVLFIRLGHDIAEVNELAAQLQVALADAKRDSWDGESLRYDTLLKSIVKPIRLTVAGFFFDHAGVRAKLLGSFAAVLISLVRIVIIIVIES